LLVTAYGIVVTAWKIIHVIGLLHRRGRFFLDRRARCFIGNNGPFVSILLAAKDEETQIGDCIRTVLESEYTNFELIVIDDRSTDATALEVIRAGGTDSRVRLLHVDRCPEGWTGKMNAIQHGLSQSRGRNVLMIDADTRLKPMTLGIALATQFYGNYDLVSFMPRVSQHGVLSKLVQPLIGAILYCWKPLPFANSRKFKKVALAWGGFLLLRRETLEANGGLAAVRDHFAADIALAKLLKRRGCRVRTFHAPKLVSTTMYASVGKMTSGWSRILRVTADHRPVYLIATLLVILFFCLPAYAAILVGLVELLHGTDRPLPLTVGCMGLVHLGCQISLLGRVYQFGGSKPIMALGHFPAIVFVVFVMVLTLFRCRTSQLSWRGTTYRLTKAGKASRALEAAGGVLTQG
jgi:chlorobactene glucosyltransferase